MTARYMIQLVRYLIGYLEATDVECLEGGGVRRESSTTGLLAASEDMTEVSKVMTMGNFSVELWLSFDYDTIDVSDYDYDQPLFLIQSLDGNEVSPPVGLKAGFSNDQPTLGRVWS